MTISPSTWPKCFWARFTKLQKTKESNLYELGNIFMLNSAFHWPHKLVLSSWSCYAFLILAIPFELINLSTCSYWNLLAILRSNCDLFATFVERDFMKTAAWIQSTISTVRFQLKLVHGVPKCNSTLWKLVPQVMTKNSPSTWPKCSYSMKTRCTKMKYAQGAGLGIPIHPSCWIWPTIDLGIPLISK